MQGSKEPRQATWTKGVKDRPKRPGCKWLDYRGKDSWGGATSHKPIKVCWPEECKENLMASIHFDMLIRISVRHLSWF